MGNTGYIHCGFCKKRLFQHENAGKSQTNLPSGVPSSPGVARESHLLLSKVRVSVLNISGDILEFPPLPSDTPLLTLKQAVKARWGMPLGAQRLLWKSQALQAADSDHVGTLLCDIIERNLDGEQCDPVVLTVVRAQLPAEAQLTVDNVLLRASATGSHAGMRDALSEGAQAAGDYALTPLMIALATGDKIAASILRERGAPEPQMEPRSGSLNQAFRRKDLADAVRHLAQGADPNARLMRGEGIQDTNTGTPLHACCALHKMQGAAAVAELLCRLGADHSAPDSEGDSPLAHARYFGATEIYSILECVGAKLRGPYYTPYHIAGRRFLGWR